MTLAYSVIIMLLDFSSNCHHCELEFRDAGGTKGWAFQCKLNVGSIVFLTIQVLIYFQI